MWNFKPNENRPFPQDVIRHNKQYINTYSLENPSTIEKLIHNPEFPEIAELYSQIPHWVIKADLARLLLVYFNGGFYCDADCFILKKWTTESSMILFTEHVCKSVRELGPRECKNPENVVRIANFCFGATTLQHPFLKEVIEECIRRLKQILAEKNKILTHQDILWTCGPDVITTIYHKSKHNYNSCLYDTSYLHHKQYASWR
jgi:mannosyltransferase OCH1-like enzyme